MAVLLAIVLLGGPMLPMTIQAAGFVPRLTAPDKTAYGSGNPFSLNPATGGNCTWYAWGRAREILGYNPNLQTSGANGYQWWGNNINRGGYAYGQTPRLGAIACWGSGHISNSTLGHVAVVEQINADGSFVISESGWSGPYFETSRVWWSGSQMRIDWGNKGGNSAINNFQGFIYLGNYDVSTPGLVTNLQPSKSVYTAGESVSISWTDGANAWRYLVDLYGPNGQLKAREPVYWYNITLGSLPAGSYSFYVYTQNSAGTIVGPVATYFTVNAIPAYPPRPPVSQM